MKDEQKNMLRRHHLAKQRWHKEMHQWTKTDYIHWTAEKLQSLRVTHIDVFEGEVDWSGEFVVCVVIKSSWDDGGHHGFNRVIWRVEEFWFQYFVHRGVAHKSHTGWICTRDQFHNKSCWASNRKPGLLSQDCKGTYSTFTNKHDAHLFRYRKKFSISQ